MLLKEIANRTEELKIESSSELKISNSDFTLTFAKDVDSIFISSVVDSTISLDITNDINILVLHIEGSTKQEMKINILNKNAAVTIREVVLTNSKNNYEKTVDINHNEKETTSDYKFFGFAIDDSKLEIKAKTKILKGMSGSDASQNIKVITDNKAIAKAEPGLFIDEFDVRASHGNSIGQVNEREMFYLESKGIDSSTARWMIIEGSIKSAIGILGEGVQTQIIEKLKSSLKVGVQNG